MEKEPKKPKRGPMRKAKSKKQSSFSKCDSMPKTNDEQLEEKKKILEGFVNTLKNMNGEQAVKDAIPMDDPSTISIQKPLNEKEVELLRARNAEYLKNFVIFGFDMRGERVLITSSKTTEDRDAILEMSKNVPPVLYQMFNGNPFNNMQ